MSATIEISDMTIMFTAKRLNVYTCHMHNVNASSLLVQVKPSSNLRDISSITGEYFKEIMHVGDEARVHLDSDDSVGAIASAVSYARDDEDSLLNRLIHHIMKLDHDELKRIVSSHDYVRGDVNKMSREELVQDSVNIFIVGASTYTTVMFLLDEGKLWDIMPFIFSLPAKSGDAWLNRSAFEYLIPAFHAMLKSSEGIAYQVTRTIVSFINIWAHIFDEGDIIDNNKLMIEVVSGFSTSVVDRSCKVLSKCEEVDKNIAKLRDSVSLEMVALKDRTVELVQERILELMTKLRDTVPDLENKVVMNLIDDKIRDIKMELQNYMEDEVNSKLVELDRTIHDRLDNLGSGNTQDLEKRIARLEEMVARNPTKINTSSVNRINLGPNIPVAKSATTNSLAKTADKKDCGCGAKPKKKEGVSSFTISGKPGNKISNNVKWV